MKSETEIKMLWILAYKQFLMQYGKHTKSDTIDPLITVGFMSGYACGLSSTGYDQKLIEKMSLEIMNILK